MVGGKAHVAAGLALAGVLLAGCGSSEGSSGDAGPSGSGGDSAITLPDGIGDLQSYDDACAAVDADAQDRCAEAAEGAQGAVEGAVENLAQAYDGATAAGAEYVGDGFDPIVRVLAVAAPSPGLWTTDSEAEAARQQLGHPNEWVEETDGVQCLTRTTTPVREGEDLDPEAVVVLRCQQTGDDLTVVVIPGGEASLDDAMAWTGEAYDDLAG